MGYPFNLKLCDLLIQAHEWFWYIIILIIEYCVCSHFGSADLQFRLDVSIFNIFISYQILNPPMIMIMVMMMLSNSKRFHLKLSQYGIQCICILAYCDYLRVHLAWLFNFKNVIISHCGKYWISQHISRSNHGINRENPKSPPLHCYFSYIVMDDMRRFIRPL